MALRFIPCLGGAPSAGTTAWAPAPSSALHQAIGTTFKALENLQGKDVPGLGGPQETEVALCSLILSFSSPLSGAWVF